MNLLNRRRMVFKKESIPEGYEILKYIQSSGHQYIDPDVDITLNNYKTTNYITESAFLSNGAEGKNKNPYFFVGVREGKYYVGMFNGFRITPIDDDNKFHTFEVNSLTGQFLIDDNLIETFSRTPLPSNMGKLFLFATCDGGSAVSAISEKKSSATIFQDKVLVKRFIALLRNEDVVPGLYDTVAGTFYTNQGAGEFGYEKLDGTIIAPV